MRKPLEKLEIEKNSKTKEKVSNNRITRDIRTNNAKLREVLMKIIIYERYREGRRKIKEQNLYKIKQIFIYEIIRCTFLLNFSYFRLYF